MHIVLGILTSLIAILYFLDRMGIDLGGLNPFYWRRRRAWARKYGGDPIYAVARFLSPPAWSAASNWDATQRDSGSRR